MNSAAINALLEPLKAGMHEIQNAIKTLMGRETVKEGTATESAPAISAERMAEIEKAIAGAQAEVVSLSASVESLKLNIAERDEQIATLKANQKSASEQAAAIAASAGHKPVDVKPDAGSPASTGSKLDELRAAVATEKNLEKKADMLREIRELRGHGDLLKP